MSNVVDWKTREPYRIEQHKPAYREFDLYAVGCVASEPEHHCTIQSKIMARWVVDSVKTVGLDWTIDRLKQALQWCEMRKLFKGK